MTVSLGMLGILVLLDVGFIVNYFVVRALRQWTNRRKKKKATRVQQQAVVQQPHDIVSDVAFAWLVGTVKLEALSVKRFPGYQPIPWQSGIAMTCLWVVLSGLLLTPDLVMDHLGLSSSSYSSLFTMDTSLCVTEDYQDRLQDLREELLRQTGVVRAQQQVEHLVRLKQGLLNDTALYGVLPYECPTQGTISGVKEDWISSNDTRGSFFPNYCQVAQQAAIEAAQNRTCWEEFCECPTLPDWAVFRTTGLADRKLCAAEVCIQVPIACPLHTSQDTAMATSTKPYSDDYRNLQLESANERLANLTQSYSSSSSSNLIMDEIPEWIETSATATIDRIMYQVNVASYIYIAYSCLALFFPSPLVLFRMPYWYAIKRLVFGVQKPYFIGMVVALWWGMEYFAAVWQTPELHLWLKNLSWNDPCWVDADYLAARASIWQNVCRDVLPLQRQFDESAVTVADVLHEVRVFASSCNCSFPNYYTSKVMMNLSAIESDTNNFTEITVAEDNLLKLGFTTTMDLCDVKVTEKCSPEYIPHANMTYLGNPFVCTNMTAARKVVWDESREDASTAEPIADWYNLWIASGFLATLAIKFAMANFGISLMFFADPFVVCAGEFLWMPTSLRGGSDKTTSAAGSIRTNANNRTNTNNNNTPQRMQQLEIMDEQGRALPCEMVQKWFKTKQRSLFHAGLSKTIFWGILVHLCMLNLFMSVYQQVSIRNSDLRPQIGDTTITREDILSMYQMLEKRDVTVFGASIGCAAFVVICGCYMMQKLNDLASLETEQLGETDDDLSLDASDHDNNAAARRAARMDEPGIDIEAMN